LDIRSWMKLALPIFLFFSREDGFWLRQNPSLRGKAVF